MKKNCFTLFALVTLCVSTLVFNSCMFNQEETYTVYTKTMLYPQFIITYGVYLEENCYYNWALSNNQFEAYSDITIGENEHNWSEDDIKDWYISHDFTKSQAESLTDWIISVNHGILLLRSQDIVYCILK